MALTEKILNFIHNIIKHEKKIVFYFFQLNIIHFPTKSKMDAFTVDGGITNKNARSRSSANSFIRTNKSLRFLLYFLYSKA